MYCLITENQIASMRRVGMATQWFLASSKLMLKRIKLIANIVKSKWAQS